MAGLYIHVPFCKTRCNYCDFFTGTDNSLKDDYILAVCKEIALRTDYIKREPVRTIYFGGGTPSQLSKRDFETVFNTIYQRFDVIDNAEITLEANPDDLDELYLKELQSLPFNRISIGIQSFDDKELTFLHRRHSAQRAIEAVDQAKKHGFENISIDLMYGLPGQTIDRWQDNLDKAISLDIQHISAYHLIYEENTVLYNLLKQNAITPVDEDTSLEMFSLMIDKLKASGFIHYEISNFAREGGFSQHNSSYWCGEKYLGIGPAAHSYDGLNRAWNVASLSSYIKGVETETLEIEIEILDTKTRYNDFVLTGMRTIWGVNLKEVEKRFGDKMLTYCLQYAEKHIQAGNAQIIGDQLKLTRNGIFISDNIISDLMFI